MAKRKETAEEIRSVRVWVRTVNASYRGTITIPAGVKRLSDVINDERQFISLTEVESKDFASPKPYLAINKNLIEMIEILENPKEG